MRNELNDDEVMLSPCGAHSSTETKPTVREVEHTIATRRRGFQMKHIGIQDNSNGADAVLCASHWKQARAG